MGTTAEPLQLRKNRRGSRLNRSHVAISDIILGAVCTKGFTLYVSLNSIHVPARLDLVVHNESGPACDRCTRVNVACVSLRSAMIDLSDYLRSDSFGVANPL